MRSLGGKVSTETVTNYNHIPQAPPADKPFLGVDPTFFLNIWNVEKEEREALGTCRSNSLLLLANSALVTNCVI